MVGEFAKLQQLLYSEDISRTIYVKIFAITIKSVALNSKKRHRLIFVYLCCKYKKDLIVRQYTLYYINTI